MLNILSQCKFSLPVYIRNGREITKILFSHFSLFESPLNAKLLIFKHNKRQIPGLPSVPYLMVQYRILALVPSVPYGTDNVPFFEQ